MGETIEAWMKDIIKVWEKRQYQMTIRGQKELRKLNRDNLSLMFEAMDDGNELPDYDSYKKLALALHEKSPWTKEALTEGAMEWLWEYQVTTFAEVKAKKLIKIKNLKQNKEVKAKEEAKDKIKYKTEKLEVAEPAEGTEGTEGTEQGRSIPSMEQQVANQLKIWFDLKKISLAGFKPCPWPDQQKNSLVILSKPYPEWKKWLDDLDENLLYNGLLLAVNDCS